MLTLGAGSSCDICFEKFGQDLKAPCSITCGHVFCAGCINNITRLCPLCRTPFEKHFCIKLHLDVDGIPPERLGTVNADTQEAQRLQQAIASVADEGTTEPRLRQLIQECKTFLHGQPRSQYKELRVAHRMIAYLCDCRTSLRSNNQLLDAQKEEVIQLTTEKKQLTTEKEELQKQIMKVMETQKYDIEMALAVEASLRDHYTRMVDLFNLKALENEHLRKQLGAAYASRAEELSAGSSSNSSPPSLPNYAPITKKMLKGAAIQDPNTPFLISPLPQFTGPLPSSLDSFTPLPELTEDNESEESEEEEDSDEGLGTPDSVQQHGHIQEAKGLVREPSPYIHGQPSPASSRRLEGKFEYESSGLSRTAPYLEHRRARSRSNPSRPTSRSHSPFETGMSITPPLSASPSAAVTLQQQPIRHASASRDISSPNPSTRSSMPQSQQGEVLRTRLHDLLRDSPASSSMPNMSSSHFPPSLTQRDAGNSREERVSPPPVRSDTSVNHRTPVPPQTSTSDSVSHLLASHPTQAGIKPAASTSPNPHALPRTGFSSASSEAKKLEEERKRKLKEERQQQYDTSNAVVADYRSKVSSSTAVPSHNSSQASSRRDQASSSVYTNPSICNPGSGSSSSRREQSHGTHGRSGSGLPSAQEDQGPPHQARYPSAAHNNKPQSRTAAFPQAAPTTAGVYT